MRKFDPIDIFFISLISAYFITLFCIGITFLYIKLTKDKKTKVSKEVKVDIGSVKNKKKISKSMVKKDFDFDFEAFKKKIISLPLIRTLFMKKVNPKKEYAEELKSIKLEVKPNEIPNETTIEESSLIQEKQQEGKTKSAKLEESNKIKTNKSENNKSKKSINTTKKANIMSSKLESKQTGSVNNAKSTSAKSSSSKKKNINKKVSSKSGARKSNGKTTKKRGTVKKTTTNKKKRSTKRAK